MVKIRINVSLDASSLTFLKKIVSSGDCASVSHAIRKAVRKMEKEPTATT